MAEFLQNNWFWIVVVGVFILMHISGMGCCGHGQHTSHGEPDTKPNGDRPPRAEFESR